jgi:hypothetical protein
VTNQPFYFEIKDLMVQFVSAFNNVVISRHNKDRAVVDKIQARYLYAPKQRVLHDLVNKAQHITLPAVAVSIGNIQRDETRVFNKIFGSYNYAGSTDEGIPTSSKYLPSPVPINIGVNMSILAKYQTDMDQILSNFIPYSNPYIIISWPLPQKIAGEIQEIRSEVEWSGSIDMTYPTDLDPNQPARVSADTTFTIKGWLFPDKTQSDGQNILYVDTKFTPVTGFDYI